MSQKNVQNQLNYTKILNLLYIKTWERSFLTKVSFPMLLRSKALF